MNTQHSPALLIIADDFTGALDTGKAWLKAGDTVTVEADGLGSLTNRIG